MFLSWAILSDFIKIADKWNRRRRDCFDRQNQFHSIWIVASLRFYRTPVPGCQREGGDKAFMEIPNTGELIFVRNDPLKLESIRGRLSDIAWWRHLLSAVLKPQSGDRVTDWNRTQYCPARWRMERDQSQRLSRTSSLGRPERSFVHLIWRNQGQKLPVALLGRRSAAYA